MQSPVANRLQVTYAKLNFDRPRRSKDSEYIRNTRSQSTNYLNETGKIYANDEVEKTAANIDLRNPDDKLISPKFMSASIPNFEEHTYENI